MSNRTWVLEPAKPTPVALDRVLILDSADADNNKLVTLSSLPGTEFFGPWTADHNAGAFNLIDLSLVEFPEISTPTTPAADNGRLYDKDRNTTSDLFFIDDAGDE